jgi:superfamily II DNA/RNA helicase
LPPAEREARIANLTGDGGQYVLVCTDCLSEGINLQESFNAVLHYDLAWNPTRHEQREGRVDRFGQEKPEVRVVTYYGVDNPIDGVILDVLIRKHKTIKSDLGVTVAVPGSSEQVAEALFEAALFRQGGRPSYQQLTLGFIDDLAPKKDKLHVEWENARDREKVSRSRFAQHTLAPEAVAEELGNVRAALGGRDEVARFLESVLQAANVPRQTRDQTITVNLSLETPRSLRQALGRDESFTGRLDLPLRPGEVYLGRTSPVIEGLAGWTLDQALDPVAGYDRKVASRCGILSTSAVSVRTTLLVTRFRYHLRIASGDSETTLVEEILPMAARGPADSPEWLSPEVGEALLLARPERNLVQTAMEQQLGLLLPALPKLQAALVPLARERAALQLATHERVREASRTKGRVSLEPILPVDILGAYVLLPRLS